MKYQKFGSIIRTPEKKPTVKLTPAQVKALKTAANVTLALIAVAGVVAISAVAPNLLVAIDKLFIRKYPGRRLSRKEKERKAIRTFYYLKKSGMIRIKFDGNDYKVFLTKLGRKKAEKLDFETLAIPKPKVWDGRFWQVAADIPTKEYRQGADLLRRKLRQMGFYPLQRTLWFYPYDPRTEIQFISEHYGITQFVTVMEINRLDKEDESKLREYFKAIKVL